ncbi:MAG: signal peptidase I [Natrialbaceae archaeon]|nr:signal peptidase I [Natrialbaceae archaeon]
MEGRAVNVEWQTVAKLVVGLGIFSVIGMGGLLAFPGVAGGNGSFIVLSDSMSPSIERGDIIVTRSIEPATISEGDVVTLKINDGSGVNHMTHRVHAIHEEDGTRYIETKGDANAATDGMAPVERVTGVVHLHVPLAGYLFLFAQSTIGIGLLVILPGVALLLSGGWTLLRASGIGERTALLLPESNGETMEEQS